MEDLIERFTKWGQSQADIRAGMVLGSYARIDRPADCFSDLDLLVVATDPEPYLSATAWLSNFGHVRLTFVEPTAVGNFRERRALFEGARDIDFSIVSTEAVQQMIRHGMPGEIADVLRRGMKILFDKDGLSKHLGEKAKTSAKTPKLPTEFEWNETTQDFFYHLIWAAKKARRGELWVAKSCCDGHLRRLMLRLIEWHTRATKGVDYDTWHRGRFLEEWADSELLRALPETFAPYDLAVLPRALRANLNLYQRLGRELATSLGYSFPEAAHKFTLDWLERDSL